MVYKFFDKKTAGVSIKSIPQNGQLAEELHKPIFRKLKKKEKCIQDLRTIFGVHTTDSLKFFFINKLTTNLASAGSFNPVL